ncbi:C2H2-type domain-containing protein [Caenorhabditis elegans]|uniref:C2H2-type domain-containing protein n=1 Tax=Caenorhabditis elegans TaxID=6239 RepID=O44993_CAEEL|nr:C2H2-type domain-containing protein [Caenorhabditis elegans]CCD67361.1 C2H2-type domain-containing protein [Caenorhabditis elegans]|eukprot:NP_491110.2 Uncharacterized protein CELE_K09H9.7 [Caenorhabditis elegans]
MNSTADSGTFVAKFNAWIDFIGSKKAFFTNLKILAENGIHESVIRALVLHNAKLPIPKCVATESSVEIYNSATISGIFSAFSVRCCKCSDNVTIPNLYKHMKQHVEKTRYSCSTCSGRFETEEAGLHHLLIHRRRRNVKLFDEWDGEAEKRIDQLLMRSVARKRD